MHRLDATIGADGTLNIAHGSIANGGKIGGLAAFGNAGLMSAPGDAVLSEAVQLAIWEIEYPGVQFTAGSGDYNSFLDPDALNLASTLITNIDSGVIPLNNNYLLLSGGGQELLTSGVPELSTWAMLVLGFSGLGFAGYRRGKFAAAFA